MLIQNLLYFFKGKRISLCILFYFIYLKTVSKTLTDKKELNRKKKGKRKKNKIYKNREKNHYSFWLKVNVRLNIFRFSLKFLFGKENTLLLISTNMNREYFKKIKKACGKFK